MGHSSYVGLTIPSGTKENAFNAEEQRVRRGREGDRLSLRPSRILCDLCVKAFIFRYPLLQLTGLWRFAAGTAIVAAERQGWKMATKMILTGDVNLMNVADPAVPFSLIENEFRAADIVFSNLECCLYRPPSGHSVEHEGFYADPSVAGEALKSAGIHAVGVANNVNYGEAAITGSIARLDEIGIAHTGAGANRAAARAPVILERDGVRFGFLQRSSVYWPTNHEAGDNTVGIAVIRGHTAYHVPLHGGRPPANRPGIPPEIVTWADPAYLQWLEEDIADLRRRADIVIASFHWGLHEEVLHYMTEIAHRGN